MVVFVTRWCRGDDAVVVAVGNYYVMVTVEAGTAGQQLVIRLFFLLFHVLKFLVREGLWMIG